MVSDNPSGADNQQETEIPLELDAHWVVGFVDGEGCFSVAIHANPGAPHGWQLTPVFQVYQHVAHRDALEGLLRFFGCGWIRPKGPASSVLTYGVQRQSDLLEYVIPFFERHRPLVKGAAFDAFATIVRSQRAGVHLERVGFESLVRLAYGMNAQGKQRMRRIEQILGSSETVRQARRLRPA
jgi:LAGLIDADG endonuclease